MSNRFDSFIKQFLLVCLGISALSFMLLLSYMDKYDLSFEDLASSDIGYININENGLHIADFSDFRLAFGDASFETIEMNDDSTFETTKDIRIKSTVESIEFFHEERDDIRVVYNREFPDTPSYEVIYSAEVLRDELVIEAKLKKGLLSIRQNYEGSIKIYLPMDYKCNHLTINSSFGDQNLTLPDQVDVVEMNLDFGKLTLDNPTANINSLRLSTNFGDMEITNKGYIDSVVCKLDAGSLTFNNLADIVNMELENNMGDIELNAKNTPESLTVSNDMGDVDLNFDAPVKSLEVNMSMGDIDIDVIDDDESLVYINKDLGDSDSVLPEVSAKEKANIVIDIDMGSVDIH